LKEPLRDGRHDGQRRDNGIRCRPCCIRSLAQTAASHANRLKTRCAGTRHVAPRIVANHDCVSRAYADSVERLHEHGALGFAAACTAGLRKDDDVYERGDAECLDLARLKFRRSICDDPRAPGAMNRFQHGPGDPRQAQTRPMFAVRREQ